MSENENLPQRRPQMPANRNLMQMMDDFFAREPYHGILQSIDSFFQNSPLRAGFPVDFFETADEWVVQAELPGVKRENLRIEVMGDRLKIAVLNDQTTEERNEADRYYYRERAVHRAERIVMLPYPAYRQTTKASFRNGILEVRGPKYHKQNSINIE